MRKVRIKFSWGHRHPILDGEKTLTVRHRWDQPLSEGDVLLMETPDELPFANARVEAVDEMTAFDFVAAEPEGHKTYPSVEGFLTEMGAYYPEADLTPNTDLTLIRWSGAASIEEWRWEAMAR